MGDYKQLAVWQKAHQLVLDIYQLTMSFPKEELYSLTSQLGRAALSIPSNIAEGSGRGHDKEFVRFIQIAVGSTNEVEYQVLLARDLGFLAETDHHQIDKQVIEVRRMLMGLARSLGKKQS